MIYLKKYKCGEITLIAACDEEIVGMEFREERLRLYVDEKFYVGELVDEEKLIEEIKKADISNLVGRRTVECAIKTGEVLRENVLYIQGVPHAQTLKL
jgi:hypothetical protein